MKTLGSFEIFLLILCSSTAGAIIAPNGFDSEAVIEALKQSKPGDTIRLQAGVYRLSETISVPSQRKLIGAGQEKPGWCSSERNQVSSSRSTDARKWSLPI